MAQRQVLLTISEVVEMTRLSKPTIYNYIRDETHDFPKQVRLGPNRVVWVKSEVQRWLQNRMNQREAEAA